MRKILTVMLALALLVPALCAAGTARAEGNEILFSVGEEQLLFEQDGLRVSLAGGIVMLDMSQSFPAQADIRDESASVALTAIVENNTDRKLYIEYTGSVNGISLGSAGHPLVNAHVLTPGSRNAVYIPFGKDWLGGADVRTLESCDLTFLVYEKPTNLNKDNVLLYEVPAVTVRFDRVPYRGLSFREGESLTVMNRDGLTLSISTMQVSKNSTYLLMGGRVTNRSGKAVAVRYAAKVNGWDIGGYRGNPMNSSGKEAKNIAAGETMDLIMPVTLCNWIPVRASAELESVELIVEVSTVDGKGNETLWFNEPTGPIWVNREAGTEEKKPASASASSGAVTPEPEPEKKEFSLMYGLAYGDSKAEVSRKIKEGGGSAFEENGALHGDADLLDLPNKSYDYLFTDGGKLKCVRNLCIMQNKKPADTASLYQSARAQLVELFGEPNGRGPTELRQSVDSQVVEAVAAFMSGPYCDTLQHDEWYITDMGPYPLKIDLFYEDMGNRESGDHGIVIEVEIEAVGV